MTITRNPQKTKVKKRTPKTKGRGNAFLFGWARPGAGLPYYFTPFEMKIAVIIAQKELEIIKKFCLELSRCSLLFSLNLK